MSRHPGRAVIPALVIAGVFAVAPACASAATRAYVRVGPPAAVVKVRPVAPGPRMVWVNGYQRWNGRHYAWAPGYWVTPPRDRAAWVPGRWHHDRRGWYYAGGHWR